MQSSTALVTTVLVVVSAWSAAACQTHSGAAVNAAVADEAEDASDVRTAASTENDAMDAPAPTLAQEPHRVMYEIYVRGFYDGGRPSDGVGDLDGVRAKLDELEDLGVETLLLMPIFDSADALGYSPRDVAVLNPAYGTKASFKALADAAHEHGMKVMLDMPLNNVSDDSRWFRRGSERRCSPEDPKYVATDPENAYCDYFYFAPNPCGTDAFAGAPYKSWHQPWAWKTSACKDVWHRKSGFDPAKDRPDRYYAAKSPSLPELKYFDFKTGNWNTPVVAHVQAALVEWAKLGADAFRIDDAMRLVEGKDDNANATEPRNLELVKLLLTGTRAVRSAVSFAGEIWANHATIEPYLGPALDMAFDFPFMSAVRGSVGSGDAGALKAVLKHFEERQGVIKPGQRVVFATNHDMSRLMTLWNDDEAKVRMAQFLTLMTPFVPLLYYGEELGLRGKVKRPDATSPDEYLHNVPAYPWTADEASGGFPGELAPEAGLPDDYKARNLVAAKADPKSLWNFLRKAIALRKSFHIDDDTVLVVQDDLGAKLLGFTLVHLPVDNDAVHCRTIVVSLDGTGVQTQAIKHAHPACAASALTPVYVDGATRVGSGKSAMYQLKPYAKVVLGE